jgi:predicted SnoaL-like aldol condensation-catalyzing enzyme
MSHRKQQVVALLKAIETGVAEPLASINPDKYIQHNLAAADGLAGLVALLGTLPAGSARVDAHREGFSHAVCGYQ